MITPWPIYRRERIPVNIEQGAHWAPEPVWRFRRKLSCSCPDLIPQASSLHPSHYTILAIPALLNILHPHLKFQIIIIIIIIMAATTTTIVLRFFLVANSEEGKQKKEEKTG
jgi:hypothetical protein